MPVRLARRTGMSIRTQWNARNMNPPQRRLLCPIVLSLLLACGTAVSASAEVHVSGTADKIVLQAKNATIGEVLEAVRSTLKLRAELAGSTARQFTGVYAGSLRRVLSRLLDGESFIISSAPDGVNIVIVGPRGTVPSAVPVRLGASATADHNPVQGWDPPVPPRDANKPVRLAAEDDLENHPLQGWDPPPPPKPNLAGAQRAVDAAKPQADEGDHHPLQGWDPPAPKANPNPTSGADDAGKPQNDEAHPVQDWTPRRNPSKSISESPAASASVQGEGNPNFRRPMSANNFPAPGIANGLPGFAPPGFLDDEDDDPKMQGSRPFANLPAPGISNLPIRQGPNGASRQ